MRWEICGGNVRRHFRQARQRSEISVHFFMAVKVGKKHPATIFRVPQLFSDVPQLFLESP